MLLKVGYRIMTILFLLLICFVFLGAIGGVWGIILSFAAVLIGVISAARQIRTEKKECRTRELAEAQQEQKFQETVRYYLQSGKKIDAIKECKDYYQCSLSKAKTIVSEIEFEMAYEREHGEDYRPYAHGRAYKNDLTSQPVSTYSCVSDIDGMNGHEFEHFCADLLLKTGFEKADVTPGSGDQGVDIVAVKDGLRYAIQCKNYASPLSNTPVQEVNAGKDYYNCHVAAVMTNSTFTPGAQKLADVNRVLLWDGVYVKNLMEKAGMQDFLIPNQQAEDCVINFDPEDSNNVQTTAPLQNNDSITTSTDTDEYYNATELYESDTQLIHENEDINNAELSRPKKRRGMAIWSKIYLGWSILCFLIFIGGLVAGSQEVMTVGLGEGLFVLVLGLMFGALAKTEKGNPYIYLGGKSIKKFVFVILCIVIAYILFIGAMGITGGLNSTIS